MQDLSKLLLRLMIGGLLMLRGIAKVSNFDVVVQELSKFCERGGLPGWMAYGAFVGEVVAPAFLIAGFLSRWAGLTIAVMTACAVWLRYPGDVLSLDVFGSYTLEVQAFYFFGGLCIAGLGSGKYAITKD